MPIANKIYWKNKIIFKCMWPIKLGNKLIEIFFKKWILKASAKLAQDQEMDLEVILELCTL